MVLRNKSDLDGAVRCYREAERINRAAYGDAHPSVATSVNNIGVVLKIQGDLDGALRCHQEAERIDLAAYGDNHPDVARDSNNIGIVMRAKGDLDCARRNHEKSLRILLRAHGVAGMYALTAAKNLKVVGGDPVAIANEVVGPEGAAKLRAALAKR